MILNGKENIEVGAICFEIRIPRKMNKKILRKVPSKIYGNNFILENKQKHFFVCKYFQISSPRNGTNISNKFLDIKRRNFTTGVKSENLPNHIRNVSLLLKRSLHDCAAMATAS